MKNKLLLSSALISGMIVGGSAIAQTSYNSEGVSGSLDLHYRTQSNSQVLFSNDPEGARLFSTSGKPINDENG